MTMALMMTAISVTLIEKTNVTTMMMIEVEDMPSHSRLSSS